MSNESVAIHAANCRHDDCGWSTMATSMIGLYGELEDHMKGEHDYSEAEWREARKRLEEA